MLKITHLASRTASVGTRVLFTLLSSSLCDGFSRQGNNVFNVAEQWLFELFEYITLFE